MQFCWWNPPRITLHQSTQSTEHQCSREDWVKELHHLPTCYAWSQEAFCFTCYHKGHYQQDYVHHQCFSCLHWQPGHQTLTCPHNHWSSFKLPLCHSPCIQKKSASSSSSSSFTKTVKKPKQRTFTKPTPIPPPSEKGKQKQKDYFDELLDSVFDKQDFNDNAITNIIGEPCGDF